MLPIGTRISFKRTILEPATGDHPEFLLAERDTHGTITGHREGCAWNYEVEWDGCKGPSFAAEEHDFEEVIECSAC